MRILLAGATGVIGRALVPMLLEAGHEVAGLTRSRDKSADLALAGAVPIVCDVYDADALREATVAYEPDTVLHELTDLPDDPADLADSRAANARIRRLGTANLLAAARAAGVSRVLAQSVAWDVAGEGGEAKQFLEDAVLAVGGVVLRYGQFYGPDTFYPDPEALPEEPRVAVETAARRTVEALDAPSGILTITD